MQAFPWICLNGCQSCQHPFQIQEFRLFSKPYIEAISILIV
ncbi:hypothetical protein HMPREF3213_02403 [Heyndrickxia coagulans]|uniref:Uncharacterized protein n=1 Tax=Heyndrickxia coagulans TaxID=1398 RepID=A0A133KKB4_HEYCO|nr:hypothetical protein HMPREF3213_02403 [Heyndrickxia coagulans]